MRPKPAPGGSAIAGYSEEDITFLRRVPPTGAPVPDGVMRRSFASRASKTLLSAVELDLFTVLAAKPLDAETLRRRLRLHQRGARDFFDALVALGVLQRRNGFYTNTPEADLYLDRNKPTYLGSVLRLADDCIYPNWRNLTEALLTGRPSKNAAGILMSVSMLIATQGGSDDCSSWMREAGFTRTRHEHLSGPFPMLVSTNNRHQRGSRRRG